MKHCYVCKKEYPEDEMKRIRESGRDRYLCDKCDQFRCKNCECLLNNDLNLDDWGHYTKKSLPYCKICREEM